MPDIGTFAGVAVGLLIAHTVADHWVQTGHQAATKGQRDNAGRIASPGTGAGSAWQRSSPS